YTASTLGNLYGKVPYEVMYPPVPPRKAQFDKSDPLVLRAEFDTPADAVVILQASRMEAWKGHANHIKALGLLHDLPNWVCWMAGEAQRRDEVRYVQKLRKLTAMLGLSNRVRFLGQRSDVGRLLGAADIYCQPNTAAEPFGIALVEALLAELPVVTTALGG